jgi:trehalose 6-phosphate synthase
VPAASERPIVLVSNRGPVTFSFAEGDAGDVVARRGAGGLVSGLAPLVADGADDAARTTWLAAAMSDADRAMAARGTAEAAGFRIRLVDVDPSAYRMAYDVVDNAALWFLHHGLWDLSRRPRFDRAWREAWASYRSVNRTFGEVVAAEAPADAAVLIQDYHLCLMAPLLRAERPDLRLVHFHHTPFAGPDLMRVLPTDARHELLDGLAAHHGCGFHSERWARNFRWSCEDAGIAVPHAFVAPLASDPADIRATAASDRCVEELGWIDERLGDRRLVARVDRIELSKNIGRGLLAFDELLERWPEHQGDVTLGAFVYPSREGLPEYLAYRQEVETLARTINQRWAGPSHPGWQPILLDPTDNYPRSVAALRRYDVLLVNPIRDGLNLVAKEGPLVNEHDGVVLLSTEAGIFDELGSVVRPVDPFDVSGTAEALHAALTTGADDRRRESAVLRTAAEKRTPADWLADQLAAAG